jgi:tetratricopeptide (TPR) repeat protein
MILLGLGFGTQANFCLAQAERLDSHEPRWPYYQALEALAVGDGSRALPKLEQSVALSRDAEDAPRLRLAELLLSLDRLEDAEPHLRHLLQHHPRHPRAQLLLARLHSQRGDSRAGLVFLSPAVNDGRTRKAALLLQAEILQRLGNPAEAAAAQRRAASLPDDPAWPDPLYEDILELRVGKQACVQRARALALEGLQADAVAMLRSTVQDYPDADDAWLLLGKLLLLQHHQPAAEQALRRATELAPGSHENVYYLGLAVLARGDRPAGIACLRKAVELKPDFAQAYQLLGNCLVDLADPKGAVKAYRTAVRYQPTLFDAQVSLATLLIEQGQPAEALVHAEQALRLQPADPRARQLMGRAAVGLAIPLGLP